MEEKLTLEHLAAYLPHGLKCNCMGEHIDDYEDTPVPIVFLMTGLLGKNRVSLTYLCEKNVFDISDVFPLLNPLSKLTEEIKHNGERFFPSNEFFLMFGGGINAASVINWKINFIDNILYTPYTSLSYDIVKKLFEWHFDVFGLIEKGLAIEKQ